MTEAVYLDLALRSLHRTEIQLDTRQAQLLHAAMGLATEAAELLDVVKRQLFYGKPLDGTNLVEEIGDLYWYLAALFDATDIAPEECRARNIAKLRVRYPDGFTPAAANDRNLAAERQAMENN